MFGVEGGKEGDSTGEVLRWETISMIWGEVGLGCHCGPKSLQQGQDRCGVLIPCTGLGHRGAQYTGWKLLVLGGRWVVGSDRDGRCDGGSRGGSAWALRGEGALS